MAHLLRSAREAILKTRQPRSRRLPLRLAQRKVSPSLLLPQLSSPTTTTSYPMIWRHSSRPRRLGRSSSIFEVDTSILPKLAYEQHRTWGTLTTNMASSWG